MHNTRIRELVLFLCLLGGISACDMSDICGNKVLKEVLSPNKQLNAITFERDCGATTGFSLHVSILKAAELLKSDKTGNTFIIDAKHAVNVPINETNILWINNQELLIRYSKNARTFKMEKNVDGVKIVYETY